MHSRSTKQREVEKYQQLIIGENNKQKDKDTPDHRDFKSCVTGP
jgi:hypothetical protein